VRSNTLRYVSKGAEIETSSQLSKIMVA
jgi:hypothetical protein